MQTVRWGYAVVARNLPKCSLPVVDLEALEAGSDEARDRLLVGCMRYGHFAVANHGVSADVLAHAGAQAERLFDSPESLKGSISALSSPARRGYFGRYQQGRDLKEAFEFTDETARDPSELVPNQGFEGINQWPAWLPEFEPSQRSIFATFLDVSRSLMVAIGRALDADPTTLEAFGAGGALMRLVRYAPSTDDPETLGCCVHSDFGGITLVVEDRPGLHTYHDDEWFEVAYDPSRHLLCTIGQALERWTSGSFLASKHRVANDHTVNRHATIFFYSPQMDAAIQPLPGSPRPDGAASVAPITMGAFLRERISADLAAQPTDGSDDPR